MRTFVQVSRKPHRFRIAAMYHENSLFHRQARARLGVTPLSRRALKPLRRPRRMFALAVLERVRLPAIVYAAVQRPRARLKAISGRALGRAGRHLDPAIVNALLSEPLGFGRLGRDRRKQQQGRNRHGARAKS